MDHRQGRQLELLHDWTKRLKDFRYPKLARGGSGSSHRAHEEQRSRENNYILCRPRIQILQGAMDRMSDGYNFHVNLLTNWALARSMFRRPEWRASSSAVWAWSRNSIAWVMPSDPWFMELDWRSCASASIARMKAGCILTRSLSLKSCRARISIFTKESWLIVLRRLQKCEIKWKRRKLWCSQEIHMLHNFWGTYSNNVGEGRQEARTVSLPINPGNSVPPVSLPRFQVR